MNYRVVLADDEPEVLRSIQRTLDWEKYGFSVVGAFLNGLDVLEFLENHDVDIVFTDIRMPFMDGIELMHKIKEKYPYIKLVIISGYDDFQYAKEALIHGCFGLYSKADQCQGNVRSSSESQRQNGYRAGRKAEHPEASKPVSGKSADHKGKFPEPAGTWKYQGKSTSGRKKDRADPHGRI